MPPSSSRCRTSSRSARTSLPRSGFGPTGGPSSSSSRPASCGGACSSRVARSLRHDLRVTEVVEEAPGVWSVMDEGPPPRPPPGPRRAVPQLALRQPPASRDRPPVVDLERPRRPHLRITVRELGDHSSRLAHLRPGTRVLFEGPYGAFTARQRVRRRVLLLAAGIGVTPGPLDPRGARPPRPRRPRRRHRRLPRQRRVAARPASTSSST